MLKLFRNNLTILKKILDQLGNTIKKSYKIIILKICNKIFKEEQIPKDWQKELIVPKYKSGYRYDCNKFMEMTILTVGMKIFEQTVDGKIRKTFEYVGRNTKWIQKRKKHTRTHFLG